MLNFIPRKLALFNTQYSSKLYISKLSAGVSNLLDVSQTVSIRISFDNA